MAIPLVAGGGAGVPEEAATRLRGLLRGPVLGAGEPGYDEARRVFNATIDRRPGLVVQPLDTPDVQAAVAVARDHRLLVSVKGGGHSAPGHAVCEGGLLIDLSRMKRVSVDPVRRRATAEGGVTWGEFDRATQAYGLAVTGGRVTGTGVGGLTLGSGSGWLERKLGFTVDNLLEADLVLATGELVRVSDAEHPDLFWGIRGGGGNFGIVTRFEFQLHPVGPIIYGGLLGFPRADDVRVLTAYRDFMEGAPDDVGGAVALITAPPEPFIPPDLQGRPLLAIVVCFTGDPEAGPRAFQPLLDLEPAVRLAQPMPYLALQSMLDEANQPGRRNYWKADMYPALPDEALRALSAATAAPTSPLSTILLQPMGGKAGRVPDEATATGWRGAKWSLHVLGTWEDAAQDATHMAWVRQVASAMERWAQPGSYLNYLMDEGERRVQDSFGGHYGRMVALKSRYDPTNFFRMNQNIRPVGSQEGG